MWNHNGYHFWGMHWLWWIFWIIIIILVFSGAGSRFKEKSEKEGPLDILKRRYANGEISTEEYEERKKNLEKDL